MLVTACNRMFNGHPFQMAGRKYVDAVRLAGAYPLIVPSAHPSELDAWLDMADGVFITGSASNVHPSIFGGELLDPTQPLDPVRDAWTIPMIRKVVARGMPLLGLCRGLQEANVALGGSLHQALQNQPGLNDHRERNDPSLDIQYGLTHSVNVVPGGRLHGIVGRESFEVNSLHGQGIDRLAPGLQVEARSPDGVVEAFSVPQSRGFSLCVQWHPEWKSTENPVSMSILEAFGAACRAWRDDHRSAVR
nr:gamma-glutamyl-gamma-aminobutyrate hydrolase family protein [uncultured Rhodoferax sp.]